MTVLRRNDVTGADLGELGRILGVAAIVAAFAAGAAFGVNIAATPGQTQAQVGHADVLVERLQSQFYAEANALNKADIGMPSTNAVDTADDGDKADLLIKQKGAELADPADRIHKQKAAELGK